MAVFPPPITTRLFAEFYLSSPKETKEFQSPKNTRAFLSGDPKLRLLQKA